MCFAKKEKKPAELFYHFTFTLSFVPFAPTAMSSSITNPDDTKELLFWTQIVDKDKSSFIAKLFQKNWKSHRILIENKLLKYMIYLKN